MPQCVYVCTYSDVHVTGPDRNQMKEFRCYEAKIEESEKGCRESNPGHLA